MTRKLTSPILRMYVPTVLRRCRDMAVGIEFSTALARFLVGRNYGMKLQNTNP
jgi:hypothetical protein